MLKFRPRYIAYLAAMLLYIYKFSSPICRVPNCSQLVVLGSLGIGLLFVEVFFLIRQSHKIKSFLDAGDVYTFISETEKEIKHIGGGTWKKSYQVNLTAGLYYLGRFEEAIDLLDTIEMKKLPKIYQYLYVNNRLANLLGLGRVEKARDLINQYEDLFRPSVYNKQFYQALQANLGAYKFLCGELQTARYLLDESMKLHKFKLAKAVGHYYLGQIDKREGKDREAQEHFNKAKEMGKGTFIEKEIQ